MGDTQTAREFYVDRLGFEDMLEMPGQALSSSLKRRGPSDMSCKRIGVHFDAMMSAVAATAQLPVSWTWRIVRFVMSQSVTPFPAGGYQKESNGSPADLRLQKSCFTV